ncbi:PE domain-containing protein [Amycolatopsis sp. NPDC023774]|uniref:PE domain-containing protein n=1 Tax=Amycolatopsis sp. NPDC023774 TaxID=3155015 RepID=UPI0033D6C8AC
MPDGQQGGLQGVYNQNLTPGQPAPANSGLLPGSNTATPPGQPPDYKALGAGQAKADFAAASGNGSWEFDPEAMDKVIQQLDDTVQGDYTTAGNEADYLAAIQPPGKEIGSMQYAATANESGRSYQQFLASSIEYTKAYRDTLIDIRKAYQNQDQAAIDALKSSGKAD